MVKPRDYLPSDIKRLFALSGNECSEPNCKRHVVAEDGTTVVGKVCHIEGASSKGPRYREEMTNDERRSFNNLILLCDEHHSIVDNKKNEGKYPKKLLFTWRQNHIRKVKPLLLDNEYDLANTIKEFGKKIDSLKSDLYNSRKKQIPKEITSIPRIEADEILGRANDLLKINKHFLTNNQVLLVNGMGGIGKSTLAKFYSTTFKNNFDHLIWIDVLSNFDIPKTKKEKHDQFIDAFIHNHTLLNNIELSSINDDLSNRSKFEIILNKIQNIKGNNLLIIDNTTDVIEYYYDHLPKYPPWKIIITSREKMNIFKKIEVRNLLKKEALSLFYLFYRLEKDDKSLSELFEIIGYHTLTIELLAKTANHMNTSIGVFLRKIKEEGINALGLAGVKSKYSQKEDPSSPFEILIKTFRVSNLNKFEKEVLMYFSILPSINIITFDLQNLLGFIDNLLGVLSSLDIKGWLIKEKEGFRIHQVIQSVVRHQLSPRNESCKNIVIKLTKCLEFSNDDDPVAKSKYLPLAESVTDYIKKDNEDFISLFNNMGDVLTDIGNYQKSLFFLESALKMHNKINSQDSGLLANIYNNLGWLSLSLGHFSDSEMYYLKALEIRKKFTNDEERLKLSIIYNGLGWCNYVSTKYENVDKYMDAKKHLYMALEIRLDVLGEFNTDVAQTYNNLCAVLSFLGEKEEKEKAINLGLKSLHIKEMLLGKYNLDVATTYNNIAVGLKRTGEFEKALHFILEALKIEKKIFNYKHPILAVRFYNLGDIFFNLDELYEAEKAFVKSIEIGNEFLPKGHIDIIDSEKKLLEVRKKQNSLL